jgi:hypothetical protein
MISAAEAIQIVAAQPRPLELGRIFLGMRSGEFWPKT